LGYQNHESRFQPFYQLYRIAYKKIKCRSRVSGYFFPQLQRDKLFGTDENAFKGMFTSAASELNFISISRNGSVMKYLSHFRIHTSYRCRYFFSNGKSSLFSFYRPPILYDKKFKEKSPGNKSGYFIHAIENVTQCAITSLLILLKWQYLILRW